MDATTRRHEIIQQLSQSDLPISATALSQIFSISRQIIVGDIALLRASGHDILATPRGYLMATPTPCITAQVACLHTLEETATELYAIIDAGGEVIDVSVDHPVYGQLTGNLHLRSRYDADVFLEKSSAQGVRPLSHLTHGVHLHTISCPNHTVLARILTALKELGVCYDK